MTAVLAIDPGNEQSGFAVMESRDCHAIEFGKIDNSDLLCRFRDGEFDDVDLVAIEMIHSYGMRVGQTVFDTCVVIGHLAEIAYAHGKSVLLVSRLESKTNVCHSGKANDADVRQALIDRFAPNDGNHGKGSKAAPGWFYGFKADVWQAYAVGVYAIDTRLNPTEARR